MNDNRILTPPTPEHATFLDKLALVAEARELWGGKVAEQLWAKLGLGKVPVTAEVEVPPEPPDGPSKAA